MINKSYIEVYRKHHTNKTKYAGMNITVRDHGKNIAKLIKATDSKTLLDYGSGRGMQYEAPKNIHIANNWNVDISLYDPAVPGIDVLPNQKFDALVSVDVFEHIPQEHLDNVFEYVYTHATKMVYLGIFDKLDGMIMPDGKDAHCTLLSPDEWENYILKYNTNNIPTHMYVFPTYEEHRMYNI